jgi:hypothetical protein
MNYPNSDLIAVHFFYGKIIINNACKDRNSTGGPNLYQSRQLNEGNNISIPIIAILLSYHLVYMAELVTVT